MSAGSPIWRVASASVSGVSHAQAGQPCQDCQLTATLHTPSGAHLLAVVADGASSAAHARIGANIACSVFLDRVQTGLDTADLNDTDGVLRFAALKARRAIAQYARDAGALIHDYACTLIGALVTPVDAWFLQIGDGVCVVRRDRDAAWQVPIWPQRGTFANDAYFLTDDDAETRLQVMRVQGPLRELAMMSDGLQGEAIDPSSRIVTARFLDPLLATVSHATACDADLSLALESFLASPELDEHTDDDKTLILACRSDTPPGKGGVAW